MVIIAIVLGLIWLVSGWYIADKVIKYYDNYDLVGSTPPYDIVKYWKMCRKERDKFYWWILFINIAAFVIGVSIVFILIL